MSYDKVTTEHQQETIPSLSNDIALALDCDFKVAIFFDIEYLRNDTR